MLMWHVCARRPCIAAVAAFVVAQVLKLFTYWYSERRWDWTRLIGSGGMPSSHTGCVRPLPLTRLPDILSPCLWTREPVCAGIGKHSERCRCSDLEKKSPANVGQRCVGQRSHGAATWRLMQAAGCSRR